MTWRSCSLPSALPQRGEATLPSWGGRIQSLRLQQSQLRSPKGLLLPEGLIQRETPPSALFSSVFPTHGVHVGRAWGCGHSSPWGQGLSEIPWEWDPSEHIWDTGRRSQRRPEAGGEGRAVVGLAGAGSGSTGCPSAWSKGAWPSSARVAAGRGRLLCWVGDFLAGLV